MPHVRHGERIGFCQDCAPCHEFASYNYHRKCQRVLDAKRLLVCAIARHEACGWREWLVSVSGYSSRACKVDDAEHMCPLVEAAAVLPPADAMALVGWPIAMAHHICRLSSSSSISTERLAKGSAAGGWTALSPSAVWCHLLTPLWREKQLQRRSGSNGRSTACMNNMHLCGWTLNAKPVSSVSREADAAVVKSMVSVECKKAKSLATLARNSHIERDSQKLLFPSRL